MAIHLTEDIRSVTDLKRDTRAIIDHAKETGRPVVLTTNGRADAVIMDAKTYEKQMSALHFARLIREGVEDIKAGRTEPFEAFMKRFKRERGIQA